MLVQTYFSNQTVRPISIGISGGWGAGKSSLVRTGSGRKASKGPSTSGERWPFCATAQYASHALEHADNGTTTC